MNYEEALRHAKHTADGFERLVGVIRQREELDETAERLMARAEELRANRFTVMVVGEFKHGKSTVLNALLGAPVLPQKATPCTAITTIIRYGDTPAASIVYSDGRVDNHLTPKEFATKYELKVSDIARSPNFSDEFDKLNEEIADRFGDISFAEFVFPVDLCRNGVRVVDSPGLEEHPARSERVYEYLKQADAIVMVLNALRLMNEREMRFIEQKLRPRQLHKRLFFVINRWNQLLEGVIDPSNCDEVNAQTAETEELIEAKVAPCLAFDGAEYADKRIFRVNALAALQYRMKGNGNGEALEATGMPAFERSLELFLTEDRYEARRETDRVVLEDAAASVKRFVRFRRANAEKSITELQERYENLKPKLDQLRDVRRHIEDYFVAKASDAAEKFYANFADFAEHRFFNELPSIVEDLNLGEAESIWIGFKKIGDFFEKENNKLQHRIQRHIETQLGKKLEELHNEWLEQGAKAEIQLLAIDVKQNLQKEAQYYTKILEEIEQDVDVPAKGRQIDEQVRSWIPKFSSSMGGDIQGVSVDLTPIIGGVLGGLFVDGVLAHLIVPGVGALISFGLMFWRKEKTKKKLRQQLLESLQASKKDFLTNQKLHLLENIRNTFTAFSKPILDSITAQIAEIDGSMRALIEDKENAALSAEQMAVELGQFQQSVKDEVDGVWRLLN